MNAYYLEEIEKLYIKMYNLLFEYARSSLSDNSLAEEVVQETFRIACQKPEALHESPNPEGWLVNVLKYVISNTVRSLSASRRILDEYVSERIGKIATTDDHISIEILYGDIAKSEEFVLLKEMVIDRKTHFEMARERGISIDACRKRVQRAKEALRNKIEK